MAGGNGGFVSLVSGTNWYDTFILGSVSWLWVLVIGEKVAFDSMGGIWPQSW